MKLKVCYTDISVDYIVYCDEITFHSISGDHFTNLIEYGVRITVIDIHKLKYIMMESK